MPVADLNNTLVADARSPARRRYLDLKVIRVIKDSLAADEIPLLVVVSNDCHK